MTKQKMGIMIAFARSGDDRDKEASENGRPVKITYSDRRWAVCYSALVVTNVEYLPMTTKPCAEAKPSTEAKPAP